MKPRLAVSLIVVSFLGIAAAWAQPPGGPPRGPGGRPPFGPPPGFGGPGFGGPGGRLPPQLGEVDKTVPRRSEQEDERGNRSLIANSDLELGAAGDKAPKGFELEGDATYS